MKCRKRKITLYIYLLFLAATQLFGIKNVDQKYDQMFIDVAIADSIKERSQRIDFQSDIVKNGFSIEHFSMMPWHMRSKGIAIAPFLIIEEVAYAYAPLACWGGRRLSIWYFWSSFSIKINKYWES